MARPVLAELATLERDLRRLLDAGARAAAGDEALVRRGAALAALVRQVPALGPIAQGVERLGCAGPRQAAAALLDLLVLVRQATAGLAAPGAPAEDPLASAEPAGPWGTRTPLADLEAIALRLRRGYLDEEAKRSLGRPEVADLRLAGLVLAGLGEKTDERADFLAEKVVPLFGPAVVGELTRGLEEGGALPAARRLIALCRINPEAGLGALRRLDPAVAEWVAGHEQTAPSPAD